MNELTTQSNLPAVPPQGAWGTEGAHGEDYIIPRLTLMHDMSTPVRNRQAEAGEFLLGSTNESLKGPIEIIPFKTIKQWVVAEKVGQKENVLERFAVTRENEGLPKEGMLNGKPIFRYKTLSFLCVLADRPKDPPVMITFKKTSIYAGKILSTHFQTCAMKGQPAACKVFKVSSQLQTRNNNQFHVANVAPARDSKPEEVANCYGWYQKLNSGAAKVEQEDKQDVPF